MSETSQSPPTEIVTTRPHRTHKPKLPLAIRRKLALMNLVAPEMTRLVVQDALTEHGWTLSKHIKRYVDLTTAEKRQTIAARGETNPDNEVALKALEGLGEVMDRAGMLPPTQPREVAPRTEGGKIRMVQIDPDGTERILEVG